MRILHLVGSPTSQFYADLSRVYASDCLSVLERLDGNQDVIAYVSADGSWRFPEGLTNEQIAAAPVCSLSEAILQIERFLIDVAIPQMFCPTGMTNFRRFDRHAGDSVYRKLSFDDGTGR